MTARDLRAIVRPGHDRVKATMRCLQVATPPTAVERRFYCLGLRFDVFVQLLAQLGIARRSVKISPRRRNLWVDALQLRPEARFPQPANPMRGGLQSVWILTRTRVIATLPVTAGAGMEI